MEADSRLAEERYRSWVALWTITPPTPVLQALGARAAQAAMVAQEAMEVAEEPAEGVVSLAGVLADQVAAVDGERSAGQARLEVLAAMEVKVVPGSAAELLSSRVHCR